MQKDFLLEMLADASAKKNKGDIFDFSDQDKASMLVSTDGPVLAIEDVNRIEVKEGYLVARAGRNDVYFLRLERFVGFKIQRSRREGAGFLT
jgi:hypothetical protein